MLLTKILGILVMRKNRTRIILDIEANDVRPLKQMS